MRTSYTTQLLNDMRDPYLRGLAAFAVALLVLSSTTLAWLQAPAAPATARIPSPIIIVASPTARPPQPTATPAPAPEVRELPSGAIVAWNGKEWQVLREAPTAAPELASAPQEAAQPQVVEQRVIYVEQPPVEQPEPEPTAAPPDLSVPTAPQAFVDEVKAKCSDPSYPKGGLLAAWCPEP